VKSNSTQNEKRYLKNRRNSARVPWVRPVIIETDYGTTCLGFSFMLSNAGVGVRTTGQFERGDPVQLNMLVESKWHTLEAKIAYIRKQKGSEHQNMFEIGIAFEDGNVGSRLWRTCNSNNNHKA